MQNIRIHLIVFELCIRKKEQQKYGNFMFKVLDFKNGYLNSGRIFYKRLTKGFGCKGFVLFCYSYHGAVCIPYSVCTGHHFEPFQPLY